MVARPILLAASLVLASCGSEHPETGPVFAQVEGQGFVLTLQAVDPEVGVDEAIGVTATLASQAGDTVLSGSGSGIVLFTVTRLEDGLTPGAPGVRLDCREYEVGPEPMQVAFFKSGGFSPDDERIGFLRAYFNDQALRLPAGTWRIDAMTGATIGPACGGHPLSLTTSVEVTVTG